MKRLGSADKKYVVYACLGRLESVPSEVLEENFLSAKFRVATLLLHRSKANN